MLLIFLPRDLGIQASFVSYKSAVAEEIGAEERMCSYVGPRG